MKIFKYVVCSNAHSLNLFPVLISRGFLTSFLFSEEKPSFGWDSPVLFRRSHAKFLARELRRSGYFVTARPYILYMISGAVFKIIDRIKARIGRNAAWRK